MKGKRNIRVKIGGKEYAYNRITHEGIKEVLECFEPRINQLSSRVFLQGMGVEDIKQELRMVIWQAISKYHSGPASFSTFIFTCIDNRLRSLIGSNKRAKDITLCTNFTRLPSANPNSAQPPTPPAKPSNKSKGIDKNNVNTTGLPKWSPPSYSSNTISLPSSSNVSYSYSIPTINTKVFKKYLNKKNYSILIDRYYNNLTIANIRNKYLPKLSPEATRLYCINLAKAFKHYLVD